MARERSPISAKSFARTSLEILVALAFLVYALETYSHRSFSPEPRYRAAVTAFALLAAVLGLLPLAVHFFPRVGQIGLALWVLAVVVLLVAGILTKPPRAQSSGGLSPNNSLERTTGLRPVAAQLRIR